MVKIHFLQKVLKKWFSFRKNLLYFFSIIGWVRTHHGIFHNFFKFFFEPFPYTGFRPSVVFSQPFCSEIRSPTWTHVTTTVATSEALDTTMWLLWLLQIGTIH